MGQVSVDELANSMFDLISSAYKKKNLKPMDVTKAMIEKYGDACDKKLCKEAIRQLIDSGRCTYSYVGGSYITLPPEEGSGS